MASAYNNDDTFNVIEEHIQQALVADSKLAAAGALEIKLWEEEHREDVGTYAEHQLPACSIEVGISGTPTIETLGQLEYPYLAHIVVVAGGGNSTQVKKTAKYYAARFVRVLQQQHRSSLQLAGLPADLSGAETGGVQVVVQSAQVLVGATERNLNVLRGLVEIFALVSVAYIIPED